MTAADISAHSSMRFKRKTGNAENREDQFPIQR
jgi:hypothetical protein